MTIEPTPIEIRAAIVDALLHATMEDGTPISSRVKAETIVDHLGIPECPTMLHQLIAIGISVKVRYAKRRFTQQAAEKRAREIYSSQQAAKT